MQSFAVISIILAVLTSLTAFTTASTSSTNLTTVVMMTSNTSAPTPTGVVHVNLDKINSAIKAAAVNDTTPSIDRRQVQYANMVISIWDDIGCTGGSFTSKIWYGQSRVVEPLFKSWMYVRDLLPGEQMDLSGPDCTPFIFGT